MDGCQSLTGDPDCAGKLLKAKIDNTLMLGKRTLSSSHLGVLALLAVSLIALALGLVPSLAAIEFKKALNDAPLDVTLLPEETETEAVKQFHDTGSNLYDGNADALAAGKDLFNDNCQVCHGKLGEGHMCPSLVDDEYAYPRVATDVGKFEVIYGGASGAMRSFKGRLKQDEILKVIAYIRLAEGSLAAGSRALRRLANETRWRPRTSPYASPRGSQCRWPDRSLIGPHTPNIARFAARGGSRPIRTIAPAVTCSVQASFLTGLMPRDHGAVGNGWLYRDLMEVWLWRQSSRLVSGERVWEAAKRRDASFTAANLFWWFAMASSVDFAVTPRPIYKADGRKLPDCYTAPPDLRDELNARLGPFPLFQFWGPATSIRSTKWIADAAIHVMGSRNPTLTLVYLPHLDYGLQRHGPDHPSLATDLGEVDAVAGALIAEAEAMGRRVVLLSEYGIVPVSRPVHINRALRQAGLLTVRVEQGGELLDVPQSRAFAVADHQIAHVYVAEPALLAEVRGILEQLPGVDRVLDEEGKRELGLDHPRSGELVALAKPDAWFTYYYWLDDGHAPDFARTVDIHRKPGYDPVELFLDPAIRLPKLALGVRLLKKALGFRTLMDVIPLDATLVNGSHGRTDTRPEHGPVLLSSEPHLLPPGAIHATEVKALLLAHLFDTAS